MKSPVLLVSHAFLVGENRKFFEKLKDHPGEFHLLTPNRWKSSLQGWLEAPNQRDSGWHVLPTYLSGRVSIHLAFFKWIGLFRLLLKIKPKIVHVWSEPYSLIAFQILFFQKWFGYQIVGFSAQNIKKEYFFPFNWLRKLYLRSISQLIVVTRDVVRCYADQSHEVIPLGIDMDHFVSSSQKKREAALKIGYVGRLTFEKGFDLFLNLAKQVPGHQYLVAGEGPLLKELEKESQSQSNLRYLGLFSHDQVHRFYEQIDLLVVPTRTTPTCREQQGRVISEAQAMGIPVIGSNCGAIPEVVGPHGAIFDEKNPQVLAKLLEEVSVEQIERWSEGARQWVADHFSLDLAVKKTLQVYQSISDQV